MGDRKRTFLVELAVAAWTLLLVLLPIAGIVALLRWLLG